MYYIYIYILYIYIYIYSVIISVIIYTHMTNIHKQLLFKQDPSIKENILKKSYA